MVGTALEMEVYSWEVMYTYMWDFSIAIFDYRRLCSQCFLRIALVH